jgi:exosortase family protein XrtF
MSRSARSILLFLGKMLTAYAAWYVLYDLWLLPDGRLDAWVSHSVAEVSGRLLSAFGADPAVQGRTVALSGVPGVRIADGCNGLSTIGLFVGFVVAYPGRWKRRLIFLPLGMAAIYGTNVGRIATMAVVQKYWPAAFGPLHGFGLTTIFYVAVFALWVLWVHFGGAPRPAGAAEETQPAVA